MPVIMSCTCAGWCWRRKTEGACVGRSASSLLSRPAKCSSPLVWLLHSIVVVTVPLRVRRQRVPSRRACYNFRVGRRSDRLLLQHVRAA